MNKPTQGLNTVKILKGFQFEPKGTRHCITQICIMSNLKGSQIEIGKHGLQQELLKLYKPRMKRLETLEKIEKMNCNFVCKGTSRFYFFYAKQTMNLSKNWSWNERLFISPFHRLENY